MCVVSLSSDRHSEHSCEHFAMRISDCVVQDAHVTMLLVAHAAATETWHDCNGHRRVSGWTGTHLSARGRLIRDNVPSASRLTIQVACSAACRPSGTHRVLLSNSWQLDKPRLPPRCRALVIWHAWVRWARSKDESASYDNLAQVKEWHDKQSLSLPKGTRLLSQVQHNKHLFLGSDWN